MTRIRANTLALSASFFVTAALGLLQFKIVTNAIDCFAIASGLLIASGFLAVLLAPLVVAV